MFILLIFSAASFEWFDLGGLDSLSYFEAIKANPNAEAVVAQYGGWDAVEKRVICLDQDVFLGGCFFYLPRHYKFEFEDLPEGMEIKKEDFKRGNQKVYTVFIKKGRLWRTGMAFNRRLRRFRTFVGKMEKYEDAKSMLSRYERDEAYYFSFIGIYKDGEYRLIPVVVHLDPSKPLELFEKKKGMGGEK